jgi:hypothetical protein
VEVKGETLARNVLRTNIVADEITVVQKSKTTIKSTDRGSIGRLLSDSKDGEIVSAVGKISFVRGPYVIIEDGTGEIPIDLGEKGKEMDYQVGHPAAVIGQVATAATVKRYIKAIGFSQIDAIVAEAESTKSVKPEKIQKVVFGATPGDEITVRGRIIKYIGEQDFDLIYDGTHFVIIHPLQTNTTTKFDSGAQVEATGIYSVEVHEGKEYPVLTDATVKKLTKVRMR